MISLILFFIFSFVHADKFDLGGSDWTFRSRILINGTNYSGKANVPGDIYTDLYRNGLINDPLYGNGDQEYRWVGRNDWVYEKMFDVPQNVMGTRNIILVFESLDTIVDIYLNNQLLASSKNMWVPVQIPVQQSIKSTQNNLTLVFHSPVNHALNLSEIYNQTHDHILPYDCSTGAKLGECWANFLRKTQSSFSWDWGPTFAISGIGGPVYFDFFDNADIYRISPMVTKNQGDSFFTVQVDVFTFCQSGTSATITLSITELNLSSNQTFTNIQSQSGIPTNLSQIFTVPTSSINLWYPNGYGNQTLYTLNTQLIVDGNVVSQNSKKIGFRTIELVQDPVNNINNTQVGLTFYFKINDIPVFLKGTNFIPINSFPYQNHTLRKKFLVQSMKEANMNVMRLWGGGLFEMDEFYEMTDEAGIMIWHDQMFACNMYESDDDYLNGLVPEFTNQVVRLRYHPSILIWAGNNENELFLAYGWFNTNGYNVTEEIPDYEKLYINTMMPLITSLDPSRPFVPSSPSNGKFTLQQGGVSNWPNPWPSSNLYGDIHYYQYGGDMWKPEATNYPIPRCATEYGVQSWPLLTTMARYIDPTEFTHGSYWAQWRQHHGGGNEQNLELTFMHFEIPSSCNGYVYSNLSNCPYVNSSTTFMEEYLYLLQITQAMIIKAETEHYRRHRNSINAIGEGLTMCALYWQLNDVWAAPTWASIDYDLNWKALHYHAKRFFAPVIVSMYLDNSTQLQVYIVSDSPTSQMGASLKIDVFTWESGFSPIFSRAYSLNVPSQNVTTVDVQSDLTTQHITLNDNDGFVLRAILQDASGTPIAPTSILLPDYMRQISNTNYGNATISGVEKTTPICSQYICPMVVFQIRISASKIVPLLWLDIQSEVKAQNQLMYYFEDNAFTMTEAQASINLYIIETNNTNLMLTAEDLIISKARMSQGGCPSGWYQSNVNDKKCINIFNSSNTWLNAEAMCKNFSSDLISIDNAFENGELQSLINTNSQDCSKLYIGLYNNGSWQWTNGDPTTYRNWESGNPSNTPNANCAVLNQNDGRWSNQDCSIPQCYVCGISL